MAKWNTLGELLKKSEIEAARRAAQETERSAIKTARDVAKEAELNKVFGGEPNFQLVGEPQAKDFNLVGEPYGGQPAVIKPETGLVPSARIPDAVLPPETNLPALRPEAGPITITPNALDTKKLNIPNAYKVGAGVLGGGLLAAGMGEDEAASIKPENKEVFGPSEPPKEEDSPIQAQMKKLFATLDARGSSPSKVLELDASGTQLGSDEELKAAQNKREVLNTIAGFGDVGHRFSRHVTGIGDKESPFDELRKKGDRTVKDLQARVENQKNDPNSAMSKSYRAQFERLGIKFKGTPSAADLEKQLPLAANLFNAEEARKARKDEMAMRLAAASEEKKNKKEAKMDDENNKFIERQSNKLITHGKEFNKVRQAKAVVDAALNDPNGIKDVAALYSIVKALDPESVVREGEIALANRAKGLYGNTMTMLSQASMNPRLLTPKLIKDIQTQISDLEKIAANEYDLRRQTALKQAKSRNIEESRFSEIDPYYDLFKEREQKNIDSDTVTIMDSTGKRHTLPKKNLEAAKKRDPNLKVVQ